MLRVVRAAIPVVLLLLAATTLAVLVTPTLDAWLLRAGLGREDAYAKTLRRVILIPFLAVLFAMLRPWRDGGPRSYGLVGPEARWRPALLGYVVTFLVLLGLLVWHFRVGWLHWESPLQGSVVTRRTLRWFFQAWFIALLEEWFFRGWMDRRLRRHLRPLTAALIVAAIYALLHVFTGRPPGDDVSHDVAGGIEALRRWLARLVDLREFGGGMLGLFLFSLLLSAAWRRTRTLWTPIAIHAAGIFVLKSYGGFTDRDPLRTWAGSKYLYDGWPGWVLLALVLAVLVLRPKRPPPARDGGASDAPPAAPEI